MDVTSRLCKIYTPVLMRYINARLSGLLPLHIALFTSYCKLLQNLCSFLFLKQTVSSYSVHT